MSFFSLEIASLKRPEIQLLFSQVFTRTIDCKMNVIVHIFAGMTMRGGGGNGAEQ